MKNFLTLIFLAGCAVPALAQNGMVWGSGVWGSGFWGAAGALVDIPTLPFAGLVTLVVLIALAPFGNRIKRFLRR